MSQSSVLLLNIANNPGEKRVMGFQPISLLSLATYLKNNGCDVSVVDARAKGHTYDEILDIVEKSDADLIGITTYTPFIAHTYNLSEMIKHRCPSKKIVLGGAHINATCPDSMDDCPSADFCVFGEGERPLLDLVRAMDSGSTDLTGIKGLVFRDCGRIIVNEPQTDFFDVNQLYPYDFDLINDFKISEYDTIFSSGRKSMAMVVSRGCPFKCTFCGAQVTHGHNVRYADVSVVLDDIEEKMEKYGVGYVSFKDSTFTINRKWVTEFCEELKRRQLDLKWGCNARVDCLSEGLFELMIDSGLVNIGFGIESGNDRILEVMQKGITVEKVRETIAMVKKYDVIIGAGFMLGNVSETYSEVLNTVEFARELALPLTAFSSTVAYPGTPLYDQAKESGLLKSDKWYIARSADGMYSPVGLTEGNLLFDDYDSEMEARKAYRHFYMSPSYIVSFIKMVVRRPYLIKYGFFYFWNIVKLTIFQRKSQHI